MAKTVLSTILLLALLVGISIYSLWFLNRTSYELEAFLNKLEEHATSENWENARNEVNEMQELWKHTEKYWAMLLDHFEIDNIDSTLARIATFIEIEDKNSALGETALLRQYIKHIPDKESPNLKNIF